jgi:hypothetical protein
MEEKGKVIDLSKAKIGLRVMPRKNDGVISKAGDWEKERRICENRKIEDLPFIKKKKRGTSYWSVKASGDDKKDFITGAKYGVLTQEFIMGRSNPFWKSSISSDEVSKNLLKQIFSDMLAKGGYSKEIEKGFLWFFGYLACLGGWGGLAEVREKIEKMQDNK